ncbi:hypothetical protein A3850_007270 [Lewinella sp. 4G2]|nr:hypothetical protein A3850_007270 [Lewinella sp. 4G2]
MIHGVRILAKSPVNIGRYTIINGPNTDISASVFPVNIGQFCSIARNVSIQEYNHAYKGLTTFFISRHVFNDANGVDNFIQSKGAVEIKNDVWVGTQCVILSGVTIGNGAIVAANSVVSKDVPDYAIVAGSPARVIGYRFDEDIIDRLLTIKWWNWTKERIQSHRQLFMKQDISLQDLQGL